MVNCVQSNLVVLIIEFFGKIAVGTGLSDKPSSRDIASVGVFIPISNATDCPVGSYINSIIMGQNNELRGICWC